MGLQWGSPIGSDGGNSELKSGGGKESRDDDCYQIQVDWGGIREGLTPASIASR